jgi:hypothetical protein
MKVLLGIQIPEDLSALSPEELASLISDLKGAIRTALSAEVTVEVATEAEAADALIAEAEAVETERATEAASLAERRDALLSKFTEAEDGGEADDPDAAEVEDAAGDEAGDDGEGDADAGDGEGDDDPAAVTAAWKPTLAPIEKAAPPVKTPAKAKFRSFKDVPFKAVSSIGEVNAGQEFENKGQLATALMERFETIAGGSVEKVAVAKLTANFKPEQVLSEDPGENIAKFGGLDVTSGEFQNAITAAFCAPTEPLYDIATSSSTARPVKMSLATYRPRRGSVSVYPSPNLSDVSEQEVGYGIWTSADDSNPSSIKECATIPCSTPTVYELYGIWRCLKVKNLMAMTFPELVDAILNRLGALHSRLGEVTLLDAMLASANTYAMTVDANAYGSSINVLTTILNAVEIHRDEERYDSGQRFDAWIPRWVGTALQIDLANQRRPGGSLRDRLAPMSDVNAALSGAGLNVTWTLDVATSWANVPNAVDGQDLPTLPTVYDIIMTPAGNFRALDRGDLTIGVTNGGIYRDNASNSTNDFSIFQENFEGLIDFGARTYALTITGACPGGAQTADVTSITCPDSSGS